jgi:hypothetical protein
MTPEDAERNLNRRAAEGLRGDLYGLQSDLEFVQHQIARLPTRGDIWRIGIVIAAGAVVVAVIAIAVILRFVR